MCDAEPKPLTDAERSYWRTRVNLQFADSITQEEWREMGAHRGWLHGERTPCNCGVGDDLSLDHADECARENWCACDGC